MISPESKMIYGVASAKGKTHDFKVFKDSKVRIPSNIQVLGDSGYQGIKDIHVNSRTPVKKPKNLFKVFLPTTQKKLVPSFVNLSANIVRSFSIIFGIYPARQKTSLQPIF